MMPEPDDVPGGVIFTDPVRVADEDPVEEFGTVCAVQPVYREDEVIATQTEPMAGEAFEVSTE